MQVQTFVEELIKWNEKKSMIKSHQISTNDVTVEFNHDSVSRIFVFSCPVSETDSYIVRSKNKQYQWIHDINIYCMEKKPTPSKLLNAISKFIISIKEDDEVVSEPVKTYESVTIDRDLGFDYEYYKKNKELESLITSSTGIIESQQKTNQLFSKSAVSKMIILEFMKLWDQTRKSKTNFKIELVNNNIFHWKLKYYKFSNDVLTKSLKELDNRYGYDCIEVDICFHHVLYPNYPPVIKVIRPKLLNSLMHKITNTRMVQLDYWTPTRSMEFIVNKIFCLLDKHAQLLVETELNDRTKYPNGSVLKIEALLLDLASFVDVNESEDIDDEKYDKLFTKKQTASNQMKKKETSTVWKAGTGYGHHGSSNWDVSSYMQSLQERDKQAELILNKIIFEIQNTQDPKTTFNTINGSVLINYMKSLFNGTTFLEMRNHISLYQSVFHLLGSMIHDEAIFLFDYKSNDSDKSLFEIINELNNTSQKLCNKTSKTFDIEDELTGTIMNLYSLLKPFYDNYIEQNKIKQENIKIQENKQKTEQDNYVKTMKELQDLDADYKIIGTNYYYQKDFDANKNLTISRPVLKRINDEISTFSTLPINHDAIIIARPDMNYPVAIRTLVTGPVNTPYENGCFIFDTYLHNQFPSSPPRVWFLNNGGKRMNPNLYADGKLCLSILGTWSGTGGEQWNPAISSLIQIYQSIQSQILVEHPYFNEPGYESSYNTTTGMASSNQYNANIKLYTMQHAILDLIVNPKMYPQFEDVIRAHFKLKKSKVLAVCEKWLAEVPDSYKNSYQQVYNRIKVEIEKL